MQQKSFLHDALTALGKVQNKEGIAQNLISACASTPKATVPLYWESSQFNSTTILF